MSSKVPQRAKRDGIPSFPASGSSIPPPINSEPSYHELANPSYPHHDLHHSQQNPGQSNLFNPASTTADVPSTRFQLGRSNAVLHCEPVSVDDNPPSQQSDRTAASTSVKRGKDSFVEARNEGPPSSLSLLAQFLPAEKGKRNSTDDVATSASVAPISTLPLRSLSAPIRTSNPQTLHLDNPPAPRESSLSSSVARTTKQASSALAHNLTNAGDSNSQPPDHNLSSSIQQGWSHSIDPSPLCATLHSASRLSASRLTDSTEWAILFVAADLNQGQDAEADLKCMQRMLEPHSDKIYFEGLSGKDATLDKIEEKIRLLYRAARNLTRHPKFVIWFTGQGDNENRMCLVGGQVISAQVVMGWLPSLHPEPPTTIIFDYCREAEYKTSPKMHPNAALIMSCSPGQSAYALRLPSQSNIPRSVFFSGLLMASCNSSPDKSVEVILEEYMGQLVGFLQHVYRVQHATECMHCPPCPKVDSQRPDLQQARGTLAGLVEFISRNCSQFAHSVRRAFLDNNAFRAANNIEFTTNSEPSYAPPPSNRTTQHIRGAKGAQGSVQAS